MLRLSDMFVGITGPIRSSGRRVTENGRQRFGPFTAPQRVGSSWLTGAGKAGTKASVTLTTKARTFTPESYLLMMWNHLGKPSGMKGKHHTATANQKNREKHLGKRHSDATKRQMSESHLLYAQTPEGQASHRRAAKKRSGPLHHNWGKPAYPGAGIGKGSVCAKGHWVRSTWERRVADWLFAKGVAYEYGEGLHDRRGPGSASPLPAPRAPVSDRRRLGARGSRGVIGCEAVRVHADKVI